MTHQESDELVDYEDRVSKAQPNIVSTSYFKDFLLRDELTTSLKDTQFEHPSEVQQLCIPKAILGTDILCQAKSGTGKTAVFVLSTLQQIVPIKGECSILVLVHTKELAMQVMLEFKRFINYFNNVTVDAFYGGQIMSETIEQLKNLIPTIIIGTPGRILHLVKENFLVFRHLKHLILDEVDQLLSELSMRWDIQQIIYKTPREKQSLLFTATLGAEMKETTLLFLKNPHIVEVSGEYKLTLHGLSQYFINISDFEKADSMKLEIVENYLDNNDFTQIVIFTKDKHRADKVSELLKEKGFPTIAIHSGMKTKERMEKFTRFKEMKERILVTTNLFARGIDVADVNVVINYDMPENAETYLHRVGRAGRFETKGSAVSIVSTTNDVTILNDVQARFEVSIQKLEI